MVEQNEMGDHPPIQQDSTGKAKKKKQSKPTPAIAYLATVPPHITPNSLKTLLTQQANAGPDIVGRLYLAKENPKSTERRRKTGGSRRTRFTEGWVEIMDRRVAKKLVAALNGNMCGSTMLTLKLLDDFTWTNLTTSLASARAAKEHKMRAEMDQIKKVAGAYREKVGKRKMVVAMQERNARKLAAKDGAETLPGGAKTTKGDEGEDKLGFDALRRRFKQRKVHTDDTTPASSTALKSVMQKLM